MVQAGEVVLARIEHVLFGQPAAAALADLAARRDAQRVFLAVSDSLRNSTGEIAAIEAALGERWAEEHGRACARMRRVPTSSR